MRSDDIDGALICSLSYTQHRLRLGITNGKASEEQRG